MLDEGRRRGVSKKSINGVTNLGMYKHSGEREGEEADDCFDVAHKIIESDEGELRFEMGIFAKMASRVTVFCSETFLDAEYISQAWKTSLEIKLGALGQVCRLPVVVELEKC